jgi:hypothetical protein
VSNRSKIKLSIDIQVAAIIRQVLFESQKGYSYEFPTTRIEIIREVIRKIDEEIDSILGPEAAESEE